MKDLDYVNIHSGNLLNFIIDKVGGYIKEKMEINIDKTKIHRNLGSN